MAHNICDVCKRSFYCGDLEIIKGLRVCDVCAIYVGKEEPLYPVCLKAIRRTIGGRGMPQSFAIWGSGEAPSVLKSSFNPRSLRMGLLARFRPDIVGVIVYKGRLFLVVVEIKCLPLLGGLYQVKKYAETFNADLAMLLTPVRPDPELISYISDNPHVCLCSNNAPVCIGVVDVRRKRINEFIPYFPL